METQAPISRVGLAVAGPPIYTVLVEVVGWTLDRTAENAEVMHRSQQYARRVRET